MKLFIISLTCLLFIRCSNNEQTTKHQTKTTKNRELIYEIHADDLWANFVNIKEPKGRKVVFPDGGKQLSVVIRKDINKDRKADLLVQIGGSETRGALYGLFLKVAEHQFKLAFYDYLKNPAFIKNKDGEFVLQSSEDLEAGDSFRVRFMEYRLENKSATFKLDTTYIFEEHFSHFSRNTVIDSLYFQLTCKDHDPENMFGKSEVKITNLRTGKLIQVIRSEEFWFNQNMGFGYEDVNFDGYKDLLFFTGHGGSYGSPTNNYYLFDTTRNRFVYHAGLTEQEQGSCGPLEFKIQKKQVISHEKSGCCWHRTSTFEYKEGKLKLVKRYTDDMATKKTEYF